MSEFDPATANIFQGSHRVRANACVGDNGIADFEIYALGYFDAARVILRQVLAPKSELLQDTLVYPVLFNLRHGIELSIKRYLQVLEKSGITCGRIDYGSHSLGKLWCSFIKFSKKDRRLLQASEPLTPLIRQMHRSDPSAQEFRYSERKNGVPSFNGKKIVDLATVLELLDYLQPKFDSMFGLVDAIAKERGFGSYTARLNREELRELSLELPDAATWATSDEFDTVKDKWKERYELSNTAFSRAINFIEQHREFSGNIGKPRPFIALNEALLDRIMIAADRVRRFHKEDHDIDAPNYFDDPSEDYFDELRIKLSPKLVGEVNAIFYQGRDGRYSEEYEIRLKRHSRFPDDADVGVLRVEFFHVFKKPSFIHGICKGLRQIGYSDLAEKYYNLIEEDQSNGPTIREVRLFKTD